MTLTRRFLISPALARLIRRECGIQGTVREGYFSCTPERTHLIRIDPPHCHLVIVTPEQDGQPSEETTEVPLSQARALLDVASGKIAFDCTALTLAPGVEAVLEQVLVYRPFNLLTLAFEGQAEAERFQSPEWVGPEVSSDPAFSKASVALQGEPEVGELKISNASLEALLDLLQGRSGLRYASTRAASAFGRSAPDDQPSNPVDEQRPAGLSQALGSAA